MLFIIISLLILLAIPFQGRVPVGRVGFIKPVFAVPSVVINHVPDVVTAGNTFPISFTITEASSSASYYYKFFGGVGTDVYKITNNTDLSYSSNWINFPQITLDTNSSNIFNGYGFIKSDVDTGSLNLKIRIASITDPTNTKLGATSPVFPIEVVAVPPTSIPTPTPTKNPTLTPTPTKIITPTIKLTLTPTPKVATISAILEATKTSEIIETPTITIIPTPGEILGDSTKSATKKNFLPLIFIILGGILLLTPLIISKIKK